jgi:hypothetical protein
MSFNGFFTINELNENPNLIPNVKGVYKVVFPGGEPEFLTQGTCGRFKDREPNVAVDVLKDNWIDGADVVYIGKAGSPTGQATLRKRIKQYLKIGQGKKVGHWGGRFIWQLKDSDQLQFCWCETPDEDPSDVETGLIQEFREQHGTRPFANLTK